MIFVSLKFLIFFSCFLGLYKITDKNNDIQKKLVVTANYIFYSLIDIRFCVVLFAVSVFTWIISNRLYVKKSRFFLWVGVVVNVSILFFFKYIGAFSRGGTFFNVAMPIGISFYIFEAISYIVDSYKGLLDEKYDIWDVLLYVGFFPTLISGPIMKARDYLPQTRFKHTITKENFEAGIQRFTLGVFEKMVMADRLAVAVDAVYSAPSAYSGMSLLWNSITYSLQLYFDFAGYTHMAIGIANIMGFEIIENFNLPYLAGSPADFWKRWHVSLSSWIMEYIYIPLGGNRKGAFRTYCNIMIAMIISGVWHGSTLNFILWGVGHGICQVAQRLFRNIIKPITMHKIGRIVSVFITFLIVNFLWVPFRTDDLQMTMTVFDRIFHNAKGIQYYYVYTLIFAILLIGVEIYSVTKTAGNYPIKPVNLQTFKGKFIYITMVLLILMFAYFGNTAFIYGASF